MQPPFNDPGIWNFAIPFAAAALLVAMLVDTQLAFLAGIITALFAGLLAPTGMQIALFAMVSCSAAVYGIGSLSRTTVSDAGGFAGRRRERRDGDSADRLCRTTVYAAERC